jgi:hypothetical protein
MNVKEVFSVTIYPNYVKVDYANENDERAVYIVIPGCGDSAPIHKQLEVMLSSGALASVTTTIQ